LARERRGQKEWGNQIGFFGKKVVPVFSKPKEVSKEGKAARRSGGTTAQKIREKEKCRTEQFVFGIKNLWPREKRSIGVRKKRRKSSRKGGVERGCWRNLGFEEGISATCRGAGRSQEGGGVENRNRKGTETSRGDLFS